MKRLVIFTIMLLLIMCSVSYANARTIVDECADLDNVYECSLDWAQDTKNWVDTAGDSTTLRKNDIEEQYLTYAYDNLKNVRVLFYYKRTVAKNAVSIFYSNDNTNWTMVAEPKRKEFIQPGNEKETGAWLETGSLPAGTKFIKVQISDSVPMLSCAIGRIEIDVSGNRITCFEDRTIVDECADLNNVYEYSLDWAKDSKNWVTAAGDNTTLRKNSSDAQYLIYKNYKLKNVRVLFYYRTAAAKNAVSIFYSDNNISWTEVAEPKRTGFKKETNGKETGVWLETGSLPAGTKFIKVQISGSVPMLSCAIGRVELDIFGNSTEYTDDFKCEEQFINSGKPWRCNSDGIKPIDKTISTGDSTLVTASSANDWLTARVTPGNKVLITTYLLELYLPEECFKIEYSSDNITWYDGTYISIASINKNNNSDEKYYQAVLKSTVPNKARYIKLIWLNISRIHLVGEMEVGTKEILSYDDFTDVKNLCGKSLFTATSEGGFAGDTTVLERMLSWSGDNTFSEDSTVVKKYGKPDDRQYIEYDITECAGYNVNATVLYKEMQDTMYQLNFYYKTEQNDSLIKLNVTKSKAIGLGDMYKTVDYVETLPDDAVRLVIELPDEDDHVYLANVQFFGNGEVTIDKLKFFSDKEQLYTTPPGYVGKTTVTGVVYNQDRSEKLNLKMWAALYDVNGRLVGVNSKLLSGGVDACSKKAFSMDIYDKYGIGKKMGIYFWDGMTPIYSKITDVSYNSDDFPEISGTFSDDFIDLSMLYDYSSGIKVEQDTSTDDGTGVLSRVYDTKVAVKYYVPNAKSIIIKARKHFECGEISVFANSYDGDYTEVALAESEPVETGPIYGGWTEITYTAQSLPQNTDFIKIVLENGNGISFTPLLKKITISY